MIVEKNEKNHEIQVKNFSSDQLYNAEQIGKYINLSVTEYIFEEKKPGVKPWIVLGKQ